MTRCAIPARPPYSRGVSAPNANIIDVIGGVRVELEKLKQEMPSGLDASIGSTRPEYVSDAIHEVTGTLADTLLIVVVVIFLFLGSVRSVLVPVMAIPVSLIGGIFLMQMFGFTLNLLTLLAIVLSVGLVVDDAIVVVENVERHLREGRSPRSRDAWCARVARPGNSHDADVGRRVHPDRTAGGLTGALFREFAFTLAGAVAISGVVALTLSPTMAAKLLRSAQDEERGLTGWLNHHFDRLSAATVVPSARPQCQASRLPGVGRGEPVHRADVHLFAQGTGNDRRSERAVRHHQHGRQRDHRSECDLRRGRRKNHAGHT